MLIRPNGGFELASLEPTNRRQNSDWKMMLGLKVNWMQTELIRTFILTHKKLFLPTGQFMRRLQFVDYTDNASSFKNANNI